METSHHQWLVKPIEPVEDEEGFDIHSNLAPEYHIFSLLNLHKTYTKLQLFVHASRGIETC